MFNILNTFYIFTVYCEYTIEKTSVYILEETQICFKNNKQWINSYLIFKYKFFSVKIQCWYLSYFVCEGNFGWMAEVFVSAEHFPNSLQFDTDPATTLQE